MSPDHEEAWLAAAGATERSAVAVLARRRQRGLVASLAVVAVGLIICAVAIVAAPATQADLPERAAVPVLIALLVDALALWLSLSGWRNISRALAAPTTGQMQIGPGRVRGAVAGLLAFLVSLVSAVFAMTSPIVAFARAQATWPDAAIVVGTVLAIGCGIVALLRWPNLLPIRKQFAG